MFLNYLALSYYKVSQIFLVEHFLYRYMITVAGVERMDPVRKTVHSLLVETY